ncbi:NAD-dependent epimerase/dehydratase family protein [Oribacterium sp. WCC10]|uniref:NAD-dependent epimerase/dehydratase family protein n=1 Tax=Oribacterium sp. WCC10 TaxID=1855343 RepID=UPI0008F2F59B|nr:NAD(P)-dependent oxidoreductase [Oribacterium sp. WCC10]SFG36411.1 Nucleoside-diphosphate-sugar epimerase [Oribacterium sp. WCC10]
MKVLITGVTSFLGVHTALQLLGEGHEVIGAVRPGSKNESVLEERGVTEYQTYRTVYLDFDSLPDAELGEEHFAEQVEKTGDGEDVIDAWLHFAWDGIGSAGRENTDIQIQNIENAKKAYLMAKILGAKKFVFAGSQAEYGDGNHRLPRPVSPYGKAKRAFGRWATEQSLLGQIYDSEAMQFIHMRIFSVYGDGDHKTSLVNTVLKGSIKRTPVVLGPCVQRWNYLEVRDCARAISILIQSNDTRTDVYDIAGSDSKILKKYVQEMNEIAGGGAELEFGMRSNNAEGAANMAPEILKLQRLGFRQEISFEEGIGELVQKKRLELEAG